MGGQTKLGNEINDTIMKIAKFLGFGFIILALGGCALNMGMVQPSTSLHGVGSYQEPLQVYIDDSIKNEFDVESVQLKTAHFKDYRRNLEEGFKSAFAGVFQGVSFSSSIPQTGYAIHLQQATPKHVVLSEFQQVDSGSFAGVETKKGSVPGFSYEDSRTIAEVGIAVTWYAVLYHNGSQIRASEGKLLSDDKAQTVFETPKVLKNALEMMMERIGTDLFRTQVGQTSSNSIKEEAIK